MLDPIASLWVALWTGISSYGVYLLLTEDKTASSFFVYGKSLGTKKGLFWQLFLLPKKYFVHFYLSAIVIFLMNFAIIFAYYLPPAANSNLHQSIILATNFLNQFQIQIETPTSLDSITSLLFTLILMMIQSMRRLYECSFISVYSSQSKINLIHYVFGHLFYTAAAMSITCPILFSQTSGKYTILNIIDNLVTKQRALAFVLFIYASHYQHKCNKILANLRKDKAGQVITEQHYVPSGGLFEYLSCPHFFTEVLIYFFILMAQEFRNQYWNLIFLLVLSSQTINAITEHRWYRKKYTDYPKERKAIFPMIL